MDSFYDSLRIGFAAKFLQGYKASLVDDTPQMTEFIARDFETSVFYVPGRMIDDVQAQLIAWRKNDTSGTAVAKKKLPAMLVALSKDYTAAPPDWSIRRSADPVEVSIPGDPLNRILKLRTAMYDRRAQIVIIAADAPTANSLAMQFHLWCQKMGNRTFTAPFNMAGQIIQWPVLIESFDVIGISLDSEQKNLTCIAIDLTLRQTVPIIQGPKTGDPNDGQGNGTYTNPHGENVVVEVDVTDALREDLTLVLPDITTTITSTAVTKAPATPDSPPASP